MTVVRRRLAWRGARRSLPAIGMALLATVVASGALAAGHARASMAEHGATAVVLHGAEMAAGRTPRLATEPARAAHARALKAAAFKAAASGRVTSPDVTLHGLASHGATSRTVALHGVALHGLNSRGVATNRVATNGVAPHGVALLPAEPWSPGIAPDRPLSREAAVPALERVARPPSGPRAPPALSA